jgi:hypothetical protein
MSKEIETVYIRCQKCNSPAYKLYSKEKAEEKAQGDMQLELNLKREYQCTNKQCSNVFQVSLADITKAFVKKSIDEGNTPTQIKKNLLNLSLKKLRELREKGEI